MARMRLADALHAVVAQRLLPRTDGEGRVAVVEVMLCTSEIREIIRNRNRFGELRQAIEAGNKEHQMQTFDQHLKQLVKEKTISSQTAAAAASEPGIFNPPAPKRGRVKKKATS